MSKEKIYTRIEIYIENNNKEDVETYKKYSRYEQDKATELTKKRFEEFALSQLNKNSKLSSLKVDTQVVDEEKLLSTFEKFTELFNFELGGEENGE